MGYTAIAMRNAILAVLEDIRVQLRLHHGGIDLVGVDEASGTVTLQFTGACVGCALSHITMKKGIEVVLCEKVPGIRKILTVDSHA